MKREEFVECVKNAGFYTKESSCSKSRVCLTPINTEGFVVRDGACAGYYEKGKFYEYQINNLKGICFNTKQPYNFSFYTGLKIDDKKELDKYLVSLKKKINKIVKDYRIEQIKQL